ncbi:PEP-utilizing enzyme [Sphingomonas sp. MMS24-JH45]
MHAAKGILTARGGMTSHAAVVARHGPPRVSGAGALSISAKDKVLRIGTREVKEGDLLTIDGATGEVMAGEVATIQPSSPAISAP